MAWNSMWERFYFVFSFYKSFAIKNGTLYFSPSLRNLKWWLLNFQSCALAENIFCSIVCVALLLLLFNHIVYHSQINLCEHFLFFALQLMMIQSEQWMIWCMRVFSVLHHFFVNQTTRVAPSFQWWKLIFWKLIF